MDAWVTLIAAGNIVVTMRGRRATWTDELEDLLEVIASASWVCLFWCPSALHLLRLLPLVCLQSIAHFSLCVLLTGACRAAGVPAGPTGLPMGPAAMVPGSLAGSRQQPGWPRAGCAKQRGGGQPWHCCQLQTLETEEASYDCS